MDKGRCVHFNGTINDECEKGINYRSTAPGSKFGWCTRIPCFKEHTSGHCEQYLEPTNEEIQEHERSVEGSVIGVSVAIAAIREKTKANPSFGSEMDNKKQGTNGFIDCPVCGSPLHYSVAPGNNHIWGQCSKQGCLSWMM